jgi:hypothetical protein
VTAPSDYLIPWRLRKDRLHLYAADRPDLGPPVAPPSIGPQVVLTHSQGTAVYTAAGATGRDTLVYGVDMPLRTTTGVVDKTLLVEVSGPQTFSAVGTQASPIIVENKWFTGQVTVTGKWYLFRNCWFSGDPLTVGALVKNQASTAFGTVFRDCTFWAQNPQWDTPSIQGWQWTRERCYIRGCTDGAAHIGQGSSYTGLDQNVYEYGNLFELMAYLCPDQGAAGGLTDNCSHLDVTSQIRGGNNFVYKGNRIVAYLDPTIGQGGKLPKWLPSGTHVVGNKYATATDPSLYATSVIMCSPILGQLSNMQFIQNWVDGGAVLINFAGHTAAGPLPIRIEGNRVGQHHRLGPNFWWLANSALPLSISGNVVWNVTHWDYTTTPPTYIAEAAGTVTTTPANTRSAG